MLEHSLAAMRTTQRTIKICAFYHPSDASCARTFETHIAPLVHTRMVEFWHQAHLLPGEDRFSVTRDRARAAEIILLFVSAEFNSSYPRLLEYFDPLQNRPDGVHVVPILAQPCESTLMPFANLVFSPRNLKPLMARYEPLAEQFAIAAEEIGVLVRETQRRPPMADATQRDPAAGMLLAKLIEDVVEFEVAATEPPTARTPLTQDKVVLEALQVIRRATEALRDNQTVVTDIEKAVNESLRVHLLSINHNISELSSSLQKHVVALNTQPAAVHVQLNAILERTDALAKVQSAIESVLKGLEERVRASDGRSQVAKSFLELDARLDAVAKTQQIAHDDFSATLSKTQKEQKADLVRLSQALDQQLELTKHHETHVCIERDKYWYHWIMAMVVGFVIAIIVGLLSMLIRSRDARVPNSVMHRTALRAAADYRVSSTRV